VEAKKSSLWGQIVAGLWIAGWVAFKFITGSTSITVGDVVLSGVSIAAVFTPVYLSILMDKIKGIK